MLDPKIKRIIQDMAKEYNISADKLEKIWRYQFRFYKEQMKGYETRAIAFRGMGAFRMKSRFQRIMLDPNPAKRAQFIYDQKIMLEKACENRKKKAEERIRKEKENDTI